MLDVEKISLVYHPDYLLHSNQQHPERKDRLEYIISALKNNGLMNLNEVIEPSAAEVEDVALVHGLSYIQSIDEACRSGRRFLDMDTYIVPESYQVALLAAGGALTGLRRIMDNTTAKAFVFNRPPGHHAEKNRAMGFCIFNNVAVAARAAIRDYGLKRIAIVDWDVHHGNGTFHTFEDEPEVLFISTHQSPAYPGTGQVADVGRGKGEGYSINIPLPAGCDDTDYSTIFEQIIIPVLNQYKPELLIVSAGQDAYRHDPLAGMALTGQGYYNMAEMLAATAEKWAKGKMLLCLEGGYNFQGQAEIIIQILNALSKRGDRFEEKSKNLEPASRVQKRLAEVLKTQKKYWDL